MYLFKDIKEFWSRIFLVYFWLHVILSIITLLLPELGIEIFNTDFEFWFERYSKYHTYPVYAFWIGFFSYITFPFFMVYGFFSIVGIVDIKEVYSCKLCTWFAVIFVILICLFYFSIDGSTGKGKLNAIHNNTIIGLFFLNLCIWFAFVFSFLWIGIEIKKGVLKWKKM